MLFLALSALACRSPHVPFDLRFDPGFDPADLDLDWSPDAVPPAVWDQARTAWTCAAPDHARAPMLGVVDFDRPSDAPRMWIVDLESHELVYEGRVAHGSGSGGRFAERFSDVPDSHQSSLGLFAGAEPYRGRHGRSLRLDGLEPANARARARAIVVHGAEYADDDRATLGRSQGCFAVDPDDAPAVVDALRGGLLLARAEDPRWRSPWLACVSDP